MTPDQMAALHRASFQVPRPWSAAEFVALRADTAAFILTRGSLALLVGRLALDEAELLTLAVAPEARRRGLGRDLVLAFCAEAGARGARRLFLEVGAANQGAIALYAGCGFREIGRRRGYYRQGDSAQDALIMGRPA